MELRFLGARGEIEKRTRRHRMHTSLMMSYRGAEVMIDCGVDWLGKLERFGPRAIVLTQHTQITPGDCDMGRRALCMHHKRHAKLKRDVVSKIRV